MVDSSAKVFNIPGSAPFLRTLIGALKDGVLIEGFPDSTDPLALARLTLYLPTRRACRLARESFLDANDGAPAVLPRIVPIGDIDEDEIIFAQAATGALAEAALALPRQIEPVERRLLLTRLVMDWAKAPKVRGAEGTPLVANTPAAALALADDLARLIDDIITRGVKWDALDQLVPQEFDKYWELSVELLKVVREAWPALLKERGAIEAVERRDRLIEAESERLRQNDAPVIAAGSTGSMPATARLIATIAKLRNGAVVLPGLDTDLDDAAWRGLSGRGEPSGRDSPAFGHPQFAMQNLLTAIGIGRAEVVQLAAADGRDAFMSEVLRPAASTELWPRPGDAAFGAKADRALADLSMVEAANAEEEALAIAMALREADHDGRDAALITPDRGLARRVLAALERWNVKADDSAGDPLADAPAGVFARLAAEAALGGLAPVTLLALVKHPLCRLGAAEGGNARAVAAIERAVLRGPRPKPGSAGLAHALATFRANRKDLHPRDPRKVVSPERLDAADALAAKLAAALAPLETIAQARPRPLTEFAAAHRAVLLALGAAEDGSSVAFASADGRLLDAALADLTDTPAAGALALRAGEYAEFFQAALSGRVVRLRERPGVTVRVLGPLEARLQPLDCVVLGGLNEGTWPPETHSDPWLSRPMRLALGLDLPERRVGLAAHDFAQALGAKRVILSRAAKVAGAPTVASRFVQRIAALAGARWDEAKTRGARTIAYARLIDAPAGAPQPAPRPAPVPPPDARPTQLSVTDIEHWLRDPYTIYAKHVLDLAPLDAVDTPPGAADRGSAIHDAIGKFTKEFPGALPADPEAELLARGRTTFAPLADYPEAQAFWWPRFQRIARWFADWERKRRPQLAAIHAEIYGKLPMAIGPYTFTLTARADRIERRKDGRYVILDYKTGAPPSNPQVCSGMAPQLTLEGAILQGGGFPNIAPGSIADVTYVRLRGGEKAGEPENVKFKDGTADSYVAQARERLTEIAVKFLVEGNPYLSLVHPMWKKHYGEYDHLARVKEWAASGGESEYYDPPGSSQ